MSEPRYPVSGAGLGLRRALLGSLSSVVPGQVDFMEVAPENWINVGGQFGRQFREYTERFSFVCHGLSLSIGSPSPLDWPLIKNIRSFLRDHKVHLYTEHLSYCSDDGQLYDLMPIPFTEEAASYVAERIQRAQDILGRRMAVENVSYYTPTDTSLTEAEFTNTVLEQADCDLLLDINNIYVSACNHAFDAEEFLARVEPRHVQEMHLAGFAVNTIDGRDILIDHHGARVAEPVWALYAQACQRFVDVPTLIEWDTDIPPLEVLLDEAHTARAISHDAANGIARSGEHGNVVSA